MNLLCDGSIYVRHDDFTVVPPEVDGRLTLGRSLDTSGHREADLVGTRLQVKFCLNIQGLKQMAVLSDIYLDNSIIVLIT